MATKVSKEVIGNFDDGREVYRYVLEDEKGQLYGIRWTPDEKTFLTNDDLRKLHRVVLISL